MTDSNGEHLWKTTGTSRSQQGRLLIVRALPACAGIILSHCSLVAGKPASKDPLDVKSKQAVTEIVAKADEFKLDITSMGPEFLRDKSHCPNLSLWGKGVDKKPGGEKGWHAIATHTLVEPPNSRSAIHRHFDPECLSCHVTGWNPQRYLPYKTGYLDLKNKLLHGNGCENCHGPASEHVALAEADEEDPRVKQTIDRLSRKTARETCLKCHDLDNSPDFHKDGAFEKYWRLIAH